MSKDKISFSTRIHRLIYMGHDKASEIETAASIVGGVDFQGAKLWILVLAIFVASLGLNTNSTAVIIGAMLISPLMGPIIGLGYGIGVYDFPLLKRAFRNYLVATLFSVITAAIYFLITPMHEAHSELLARTSPTIFDVGIAFCGGLAGIIGLGSKSQRTGNVIPGVAIATALMPPLCTVGFGLANGEWYYAAGAFYLYIINTIFIALSTFVGVRCMGFHKQALLNGNKEKNVKKYISIIAILTIIPSVIFTINGVKKAIFESNAHKFIRGEFNFEKSHVVDEIINYESGSIKIIVVGKEIDSLTIANAKKHLAEYELNIPKDSLMVSQESAGMLKRERQMIMNHKDAMKVNMELMAIIEDSLRKAQTLLDNYHKEEKQAQVILPEIKLRFPEVQSLTIASGAIANDLGVKGDTMDYIAIVRVSNISNKMLELRIQDWLCGRTSKPKLRVLIEKAK